MLAALALIPIAYVALFFAFAGGMALWAVVFTPELP